MKKRLIAIFTAVVIVALILAASFQYVQFVSDTIYSESVAHLREIYHQANQSLYSLVGRNWSLLRMWAPYLQDIHEVAKVRQYVETLREQTGFTDFYFISREGGYITADGKTVPVFRNGNWAF